MKKRIAPSILSADFSQLLSSIELINQSRADWFHLDVMDGCFVPNISFGMPVVNTVKKHAQKPLDVHLMIVQPERYINDFKVSGADILSVHYEACTHLHRTLFHIKEAGMKAGVALNPHTPVCLLKDIITEIDLLALMSVNPGFGGQAFITQTLEKIHEARLLISEKKATTLIEVDGGVDVLNASKLFNAGADVLVAGTAIFGAHDPLESICKMKNRT
ncbi:ribulose-phosphate 3-epimerase [Bacteroidetes bacterium endosymbiont of Geopemphigus sp.]|uniref:ribulose-phosphate 3-epimerase n=1 Tax=Bacteroidetes bacterium endosymbiont of Geopemphigus sp. TaxID=2047937 RepID=UPI000CD29212|nr:ribulose-phosphate 3-epimerase [Bacteroidetes bacterium endosymbiont of Geopemphigus sp.]